MAASGIFQYNSHIVPVVLIVGFEKDVLNNVQSAILMNTIVEMSSTTIINHADGFIGDPSLPSSENRASDGLASNLSD